MGKKLKTGKYWLNIENETFFFFYKKGVFYHSSPDGRVFDKIILPEKHIPFLFEPKFELEYSGMTVESPNKTKEHLLFV